MWQRFKDDFRLSVMMLLGACAVFGITPFAILRFYQHNTAAGMADITVLTLIILTNIYAWRTGDTRRAGPALALFTCTGAVVVSAILGDFGVFWMFPALLVSFFLARPTHAVAINATALMVLALYGKPFPTLQHLYSFMATAIIVSVCSWIFAIRHESQRQMLEELASRDALTGAHNRRSMEEALRLATESFARVGTPQALVMIDLDHFKQINDSWGHAEGDAVLVECARLLRDHTRASDLLFRFGGEEFVLLMPGISPAGVRSVVTTLHRVISENLTSPGGPVTASFGVAMLLPGESWQAWLSRADEALYQAKESGRNCIVIDEPEIDFRSLKGSHATTSAQSGKAEAS